VKDYQPVVFNVIPRNNFQRISPVIKTGKQAL
jgi:hypothetical protein